MDYRLKIVYSNGEIKYRNNNNLSTLKLMQTVEMLRSDLDITIISAEIEYFDKLLNEWRTKL